MKHRPVEPHQPTSPRSGTAQDIWVALLADLIVAEVVDDPNSETANQPTED